MPSLASHSRVFPPQDVPDTMENLAGLIPAAIESSGQGDSNRMERQEAVEVAFFSVPSRRLAHQGPTPSPF
jgi:hypothetical protein